MRKSIHARLAVGLAVVAAYTWTARELHAALPSEPAPVACTVTFDGASIAVSSEPFAVHARYSEAIGDSLSAEFQPESKIAVLGVASEENARPQSVRMMLNTSEAVAGEWTVTLKGTGGSCTGEVSVAAGGEEK